MDFLTKKRSYKAIVKNHRSIDSELSSDFLAVCYWFSYVCPHTFARWLRVGHFQWRGCFCYIGKVEPPTQPATTWLKLATCHVMPIKKVHRTQYVNCKNQGFHGPFWRWSRHASAKYCTEIGTHRWLWLALVLRRAWPFYCGWFWCHLVGQSVGIGRDTCRCLMAPRSRRRWKRAL